MAAQDVATVHGHTSKHMAQRRVAALREPLLRERLLAEVMGTFFLVLTVGVSVAGGGPMAAVAIGLVLGISIYTFAAVSGGMFNPAVTLAVLLSGRDKISPKEAGAYIVAQCLGGFCGAALAYGVTDSTFFFTYEETHSYKASMCLETCFTLLLCSIVLAAGTSNDAPNHYFGFAIGMAVTGGAFASGGFDQGSFNPAVTLGINLVHLISGSPVGPSVGSWFVFLLAPLLGGGLAAAIFRGTRGNEFEAGVRNVDVEVAEAPAEEVVVEANA